MANAALSQAPILQLTLSQAEAQTLFDVLHMIGGSPDHSRRKHTHSILAAMLPLNHFQRQQNDVHSEQKIIYFLNKDGF